MDFAQRHLLSSMEKLTREFFIGKLQILLSHLLISKVSDQLVRVKFLAQGIDERNVLMNLIK